IHQVTTRDYTTDQKIGDVAKLTSNLAAPAGAAGSPPPASPGTEKNINNDKWNRHTDGTETVTADQASNYANSAWTVTSVTIDTHRVEDITNTLVANDGTTDTPSSSGGTPSPSTQTTN